MPSLHGDNRTCARLRQSTREGRSSLVRSNEGEERPLGRRSAAGTTPQRMLCTAWGPAHPPQQRSGRNSPPHPAAGRTTGQIKHQQPSTNTYGVRQVRQEGHGGGQQHSHRLRRAAARRGTLGCRQPVPIGPAGRGAATVGYVEASATLFNLAKQQKQQEERV